MLIGTSYLPSAKNSSPAFIDSGLTIGKKATEKFSSHEASHTHQEARLKRLALGQPSLPERFSEQTQKEQASRRKSLLTQLSCLRYLLRQGLSIRGHNTDQQGNLRQLLVMMAGDCNPCMTDWIKENKYMSPEIVNEQITMMGLSVLRTLLSNIKMVTPSWYSIIADEATDVANREQLNLSLRWVNVKYEISEDPVGLVCLPNTTADTITQVLKDLLIQCDLFLPRAGL